MSATFGDFVIERLHEWGVRLMFGYPGDGIKGDSGGTRLIAGSARQMLSRILPGDKA